MNMNMKIVLVFVCYIINDFTSGAKILAPFIFPSYSHQIVYHAVCKELAVRGHQVTFFTANPMNDSSIPNLQQIDISFAYDIWQIRKDLMKLDGSTSLKVLLRIDFKLLGDISDRVLASPEMQKLLLNGTESFDLVLVEWMHPALYALSARFNCPLIGLNSMDLLDPLYADADNPINPIIYPNMFLPFSEKLSFWQRLASVEFSFWLRLFFDYEVYPSSDEIVKRNVKEDLPPIKEITQNVSMIFVNTNPLFSIPKATVPTVIEFSGVHLKPPKPLPQEIKEFLDDAPNGVIYFSLGSNIKSSLLPKKLKQEIFDTFNDLPYKILWKFEESNISQFSSNVKIEKWLPQQDILSHPNIKLFITQGGLQSLEEAIRNRVPLVGMPFYIDQPKNMNRMEKLGIGKVIDKSTLTKKSFKSIIIEVAENSKYRTNVEHVAALLEDQPMKSLDKVIWWIEYVIRNRCTKHMKSQFLQIPWYQYYMLDILAFLLFCLVITLLIFTRLLKFIHGFLKSPTKQKIQ